MLATVAASPLTIAWVMIWSLVSSFCLTSGDTLELSILCLYLLFQGTGATPSRHCARRVSTPLSAPFADIIPLWDSCIKLNCVCLFAGLRQTNTESRVWTRGLTQGWR